MFCVNNLLSSTTTHAVSINNSLLYLISFGITIYPLHMVFLPPFLTTPQLPNMFFVEHYSTLLGLYKNTSERIYVKGIQFYIVYFGQAKSSVNTTCSPIPASRIGTTISSSKPKQEQLKQQTSF